MRVAVAASAKEYVEAYLLGDVDRMTALGREIEAELDFARTVVDTEGLLASELILRTAHDTLNTELGQPVAKDEPRLKGRALLDHLADLARAYRPLSPVEKPVRVF